MSDSGQLQVRSEDEDERPGARTKTRSRIGPLDIRLILYEEVLKLRRNSYSYKEIIAEIAQKHQITLPKSTVSYWVNEAHTPFGGINLFKPKPTPELAYVIGVLAGEASLNVRAKNYEYRIRLKAVDRDFVEAFNVVISKVLNCRPHKILKGNTERESYVDVSSYLLHKFLQKPLTELRPFIEHDSKCVSRFLLGFFDSEGCFSSAVNLTASNTDLKLLNYVQDLLADSFGIETTGPHLTTRKGSVLTSRGKSYLRKSDCYQIYVRRKFHKEFYLRIGLTIQRKGLRLEQAVSRYKFRMK